MRGKNAAYMDGYIAHKYEIPVESCPYQENTQERHAWVDGWNRRFAAVKHGTDDVEDLDEEVNTQLFY